MSFSQNDVINYVTMLESSTLYPIDIELLEDVKQDIQAGGYTELINGFIDREISYIKSTENVKILDDERDSIVYFLQDLLNLHHSTFGGSSQTIDSLSRGLEQAIVQNNVLAASGNYINEIFAINGIVRGMIDTYHYLRLVIDIPEVEEQKINDSIVYLLKFSNNPHLSYHLEELKKVIPDRTRQANKIYSHLFYHVVSILRELLDTKNDEAQEFANIILENVFESSKSRITGDIQEFKLHNFTLKYFKR